MSNIFHNKAFETFKRSNEQSDRTFLKPIVLAIGYMALIFGLSSIPDYGKQTSFNFLYWISPTWQNLLHIPAFGLLAFLWMRVFKKKGASFWKAGLWTVLISVSYGFSNELYQLVIPGRYASAGDFVFDVIGILSGVMVYSIFFASSASLR